MRGQTVEDEKTAVVVSKFGSTGKIVLLTVYLE